jgi:hypothetical protein
MSWLAVSALRCRSQWFGIQSPRTRSPDGPLCAATQWKPALQRWPAWCGRGGASATGDGGDIGATGGGGGGGGIGGGGGGGAAAASAGNLRASFMHTSQSPYLSDHSTSHRRLAMGIRVELRQCRLPRPHTVGERVAVLVDRLAQQRRQRSVARRRSSRSWALRRIWRSLSRTTPRNRTRERPSID